MTFSEQIDKFAKETKDTVDILCRIAKRQGKDEMLDIIDDIKAEIEQLNPVDYGSMFSYESHNGAKDMKRDVLDIIDRHIGGKEQR